MIMTEQETAQHLATSQQLRDAFFDTLKRFVERNNTRNESVYTAMGMVALEIARYTEADPATELDSLIHEAYVLKSMLDESPALAAAVNYKAADPKDLQ